jgi:cobalt-zinc-cadmium efflux system outer membrane protein
MSPLLLATSLLLAVPHPPADGAQRFVPAVTLDLPDLERIIAARTPALEAANLEVEVAEADRQQSRLLPNPSLDLGWGTVPVGPLNPPGLARPLANVPNYAIGLSYTVPVGKRRPRIQRATALAEASRARREALTRTLSLQFAGLLGQLAVATLRREGARSLVEDAARAVEVASTRLASGFGTPLDLDRLRIDLSRSEQLLRSVESDLSATLAACSGLVAMRCEAFTSSAEARGFLARWIDQAPLPTGALAERPDLRALAANERAATAELRLARAQRLPDPTVRLGYLHDRFVISGNQMNSLNLGVSFPLPLFDHGQAMIAAARARQARFAAERRRRLAASEVRSQALRERVAAQRTRQHALSEQIIPRARALLDEMERAAETRLVALGDVLQSRRTMSELLLEEADSYADAFDAYLELLAEFPREEES